MARGIYKKYYQNPATCGRYANVKIDNIDISWISQSSSTPAKGTVNKNNLVFEVDTGKFYFTFCGETSVGRAENGVEWFYESAKNYKINPMSFYKKTGKVERPTSYIYNYECVRGEYRGLLNLIGEVTLTYGSVPDNGIASDGFYYVLVKKLTGFNIKLNGIWKEANSVYVKVNGIWKLEEDTKIKSNGVWK